MKKWCFLTPHHTGHMTTWRALGGQLGGHLADHWWTLGVSRSPCHVVRDGNSANLGGNSANWGGGQGLGSHLAAPPPHIRNSSFLSLSPYLNDFRTIFLLLFFPLDTALLFYVKAAIMGWLLLAVQL